MFETYLRQWDLKADGVVSVTRTARLLPVRWQGAPAMLKVFADPAGEDLRGSVLLTWWNGDGAARVFAQSDTALLMERAIGPQSLAGMAANGRDDEACRLLCAVAARLHAPRPEPLPPLTPLQHWFAELAPVARTEGGILMRAADTARILLADPRDVAALHGDLHHGNVLDFGARGWLAIDPKALLGERGFDFAAMFANPDLADPTKCVARDADRFVRRIETVAAAAGLERLRLLNWILAGSGLSAAWLIRDRDPLAAISLRVARLAAAELDR